MAKAKNAKQPEVNQVETHPAENLERTNADAQEQRVENLERTNADTGELEPVSGNVVYVFANLPNGQKFSIGRGKIVTIDGFTVDGLRNSGGGFAGGKYAVTMVPADDWREIMRVYGNMRMFKSGLVFAADSIREGEAMARERGGLRHGWEPADPEKALSQPKTDKD